MARCPLCGANNSTCGAPTTTSHPDSVFHQKEGKRTMSEVKPYRVVLNGAETTLLLDDDDAKMWGVEGQSVKDAPADLNDPDTVAAAEAALEVAAAEVAAKQKADQEAAEKAAADAAAEAEKAAPAPQQNKQRRAPRSNKSNG